MSRRHRSTTAVLRHRVFLAVTAILLVTDGLFFGLNAYFSTRALEERFKAWGEERRDAATLLVEQTIDSMLLMAEVLAQDRDIHALARAGRAAVTGEGGGPGGPLAAEYRARLLERLGPAWRVATERYGVRQLHFHFGPGDLSFLRVHAPDKFGDRMDDLRPLVVDAIAQGTAIGGFELGRIYSGLRGIVPIFDQPGVPHGPAIGAVEVGTAFDPVLGRIHAAAGGDYAVILQRDRVDMAVFAEHRAEAVEALADCGCVLEATTGDRIGPLVAALPPRFFADPVMGETRLHRVETVDENGGTRVWELAAWPLMDHKGATRGGEAPGWVVTWLDATPIMADHRKGLLTAAGFAVAAFLLLEVAIFLAVRFSMRALERRVDDATVELSASNAALVEANAAKSRFLSTMSHEIRTPMNGVLGMAELLSRENLTAKQARMVATIRSSGALLLHTIGDILDVSKLDAGKVSLERIAFDVADVAREVADVQRAPAAAKGLDLAVDVSGAATRRLGDPHRVAQILHNLASNAIKFTDKGTVTITVDATADDCVTLSVLDQGIGMTPEQARRVFSAFEQADASTTRRSGGTGLGLSIVKGLVERMDGRIALETAPGRGTTFTIHLPLAATAERLDDVTPAAEAVSLDGLRVLAVDDNEVNRMVLEALLERLGVAVTMVDSGRAALDVAARGAPFDAILLDVVMPDMDGLETLRRLHARAAEDARPMPPVIACTARTMPEEIAELIAAGFASHLAKPIDTQRLRAVLAGAARAARRPEPAEA